MPSKPTAAISPIDDLPRPRNWIDLEHLTTLCAARAGEDPQAALRDLRRKGAVVRLICLHLGIEVPRRKRGPKAKPQEDDLVVTITDAFRRDYGLKGRQLAEKVHAELAIDSGLMGVKRNITPASIERQYHRRKRAKPA